MILYYTTDTYLGVENMEIIYNLDDIFCVENAQRALIEEVQNLLKNNSIESVDFGELLDEARMTIVDKIIRLYKQGYYDRNYQGLESKEAIGYNKSMLVMVDNFNNINEGFETCDNILDNPHLNEKWRIEKAEKLKGELIVLLNSCNYSESLAKGFLSLELKSHVAATDLVFKKLDNGMVVVQDWIKPYLDNISFASISLAKTNIENYDFSGTKGFTIDSYNISDDTLANTVLKGVSFNCYYDKYSEKMLRVIDASLININGADFTGSRGAIVSLENVETLPDNCNLTDALIIVKSREDVAKFNLERFGNNFSVIQKGIVDGKVIDVNLNNFFSYTGLIDKYEFTSINNALKFDCTNYEEIRIENNKMLAYLISLELSSLIDYDFLYNIFKYAVTVNDYHCEEKNFILF